MLARVFGAVVLVAGLLPQTGKAQAFQVAEGAPRVTAASAGWQLRGDSIFYAGSFYYPTGPSVFFDPYVMVRTGNYQGVPLYADTTLEPYSLVFVPIGGNVMRPYERRRTGELTGTVGSRMPSFPIDRDVDASARTATTGLQFPPPGELEPDVIPESTATVGTGGSVPARPPRARLTESIEPPRPQPTHVESIPGPAGNSGIWLEYAGAKWRAAGAATEYVPARYLKIGEYHGFPVYRLRDERVERIYVPVVAGGPLTRYERP